jgi:GntR family carbon starvation induced transcriptional regulator
MFPDFGMLSDMAGPRLGKTLVEDVYGALRADLLFGRLAPGERIPLRDLALAHEVSVTVVREAVTRLASEGMVQASPQQGFRVRALSIPDLVDLTWMRVQLETLALREAIAKGDVAWEANLVAAHHTLASTVMYFDDLTPNEAWMQAHSGFHAALTAACASPLLIQFRQQLFEAAELYRHWSAQVPGKGSGGPRRVSREHKAIFEATLARDDDLAVRALTEHLEKTARLLLDAQEKSQDNGTRRTTHRQEASL